MDQKPELIEPTEVKAPNKPNKKVLLILLAVLLIVFLGGLFWMMARDKLTQKSTDSSAKTSAKTDPKVRLVLFATGTPTTTAIVSTKQSGDNRVFAVDRDGIIRIVDENGQVQPELFLDISDKVHSQDEMGLLGMAFSPNYPTDGNFFVNYINNNQETVIARYNVPANTNKANPNSAAEVLTFKQPYPNHNGGDLLFGPDGYLYIAVGDGGGAGDPENRSQDLNSLFGKILRIDVGTIPYKIPPTNPFADQAGKKGEIWDYGLRNPWRISFDRQTNDLYISDVGQKNIEELDVELAGSKGGNNYGWSCYEGNADYKTDGCKPKDQYVFPAFEYKHDDERCSITGGYVYRGQKYPNLSGQYIYGDFCTGEVFRAEKSADGWQSSLASRSPYQISTFGEDSQGELYLADFNAGSLYRIEDSSN